MDYKQVRRIISTIVKAIKEGNYSVSYDEPNFIEVCTAPNGRTFYRVIDMDGPKTSSDSGRCVVEVEGYSFSCDLGNGDYESAFFDEIDDIYELKNGSCVEKSDLTNKIVSALDRRKDIYFHLCEMDEIMAIYAKINNIKEPEYYWWEDEDCPVDVNGIWNYTEPKELGYGVVYFKRCKYYLVEKPNNEVGELLHAVHCRERANDHGQFRTVLLTLSFENEGKMKVLALEDCDERYNAVEESVE